MTTYRPIIIRLISTFNIDTMEEAEDPTNYKITYNSLREIKIHIKYGEI